jgi:hypothetical protein
MSVPTYPARPPFFAMRFVRAMVKTCVATEHGADVFALLTIVATTEDAAHYRRAVVFLNDQLASVCGLSLKQLIRVRGRAVAAGWLHYVPGRRGVAPRYWVTIPDHAADLDDLPTDEGDDEIGRAWASDPPPDCCPIDAQNGPTIGHQSGINRAPIGHQSGYQSGNTYIPVPDPDPEEYSAPPTGCPADGLTESDPPPSVRVFVDAWNAAGLIPRSALSDLRARWQKAWREFAGFRDRWRQAVEHAGKQARCRPGGEFPLSPEFLLGKESAVERVLAGEFDDRAAPARSPPGPPRGRSSADVAARAKARVEDMRRRQAADAG